MISKDQVIVVREMLRADIPVQRIVDLTNIGKTKIYEIKKYLNEGTKEAHTEDFLWKAYPSIGEGEKACVGVISDTHFPFVHPNYLQFCIDTFVFWGVNTIVHIGDLVDNHYISFHETNPDGMSAKAEYEQTKECIREWAEVFPYVKWCIGNHDKLPERRLRAAGLPSKMLIPNYYGLPEGWDYKVSHTIDDVMYVHGIGSAGVNGHRNLSLKKGKSVVMGHCHSFGGVSYCPTEDEDRWGMNVGCGIDIDAYAFDYAKDFPIRPTLGCGIVKNGKGYFISMDMDKYGRDSDNG